MLCWQDRRTDVDLYRGFPLPMYHTGSDVEALPLPEAEMYQLHKAFPQLFDSPVGRVSNLHFTEGEVVKVGLAIRDRCVHAPMFPSFL